jgi:hypothetical protein
MKLITSLFLLLFWLCAKALKGHAEKKITLFFLVAFLTNTLFGQSKSQAFNLGSAQLLGTHTTSDGVIAYTSQGTRLSKFAFSTFGILVHQSDIVGPTLTVVAQQIVKRDLQGIEIFRKTIPTSTLARFDRVERAIELNNTEFVLTGFQTVGTTIFIRLVKCNNSLQIIKEVLLHSETISGNPTNPLAIGLLESYQGNFDIAFSQTSFPTNASDKLSVKLSRYDANLIETKTYSSEACHNFTCIGIEETILLTLRSNLSTSPSPYGGTLSNGHTNTRYFERAGLNPEVNVQNVVYWEVWHNTPGRRDITTLTYPTVPTSNLPGTVSYGKYTNNGLLLAATYHNDGLWFSMTGNSVLGSPDLACRNVQAQQNGQQLEIGYQLRNITSHAAQAFIVKYQLVNVDEPIVPQIPLGEQSFTGISANKDTTILTTRQILAGLTGNYRVSVVILTLPDTDADPSNQSALSSAFQLEQGGSNTACSNNLLSNPSFDQGLSIWSGSGGTVAQGNLEMSTVGSTLIQTVAGEAGKSYTFLYTAKTLGMNQNITFGLKFLSSTWNLLDSKWSSFDSPGVFSSNQLQANAPAGTAWVEVAILKTNGGGVQISEVCLSNGIVTPAACTANILPASGLFGNPCITVGSLEMTVQDTGLYQLSFDAFVSSGTPLIGGYVRTHVGNTYYHFNDPAQLPQGFSHQDFGIYLSSDAKEFAIIYYANSSTSCTQITNACLQKRIIGKPELELKLIGNPPTKFYPGQQTSVSFDVKNLSETSTDTAVHVIAVLGADTIYSKFHLLQAKDSIRITVPFLFKGNALQNYAWMLLAVNENKRVNELFFGNNKIFISLDVDLPPTLPASCLKTDLPTYFKCAKKTATGFDVAYTPSYYGNDSTYTFLSLNSNGEVIGQNVKVLEAFRLLDPETIVVENISGAVLRTLKIPQNLISQFGANWRYNESAGVFYFYWIGSTPGTYQVIATNQQFAIQRNFLTAQIGSLVSVQGEMLITQTYYIVPIFYPPNFTQYQVRYEHHLYTFSGIKSRYITPYTTNSNPPFPRLNACGEIQFDNVLLSASDTTVIGNADYANSQLSATVVGMELSFSSPQLTSPTKAPVYYYSAARVSESGKLLLFGTSNGRGFYYQPNCSVNPPNQTCTNNLLTNPSFATNLTGWNGAGGTWANGNLELCQSGNQYIQTVAGEAGKTYQLHYTAKTAGTNQNVLFGLKFLSASWNVLGTEYSSFDSPGVFGSNFISKVAPAGTAWVEVSITKQNNGCIQVSEVCLTKDAGANPCSPDVTPPTLAACPANITQTIPGGTGAMITFSAPAATDNCAGTVNVSSIPSSGAVFPIGTSTVVFTARDAAQNTRTCSFTVTVNVVNNPCAPDVTPPVLSACPPNQTLTTSTGSEVATWIAPTATDNCAGSVTVTGSATSGLAFAVGATTVIYTARDAAQNTATCSFVITVIQSFGGTCNANLVKNGGFEFGTTDWATDASFIAPFGNPYAGLRSGEICGGRVYQFLTNITAGQSYRLAMHTRSIGGQGNMFIKFMNANYQAISLELLPANITQNYVMSELIRTAPANTLYAEVGLIAGGCVDVDEMCFSVQSSSNPCSPDVTKPVLTACPANQTLTTTSTGAVATWTAPTATDNCPGAVTVTYTAASGQIFPVGATTVTYTARDAAQNTATCSFIITVQSGNQGACTNNLLTNPSFATNLTGWNGAGGTWSGGNLEMCQTGNQYIQTVAGEAGRTYQFQYTAKTAGTNQNVLFGLKFLSASWNVLGTQYSSFDSQGTFGSNSISKLAPAGTAWVEVSITKQNNGCIQVSEVCLTKSTTQALQSSPHTYTVPDPLDEVTIYPNPAAQQAFIDLNVLEGAQTNIRIFDAFGKLQFTTSSSAPVVDLDLTGWQSGLYMVRLETEGHRAQVLKLVVEQGW